MCITLFLISGIIFNLDSHNAIGDDAIQVFVIKKCAPELSPIIYNYTTIVSLILAFQPIGKPHLLPQYLTTLETLLPVYLSLYQSPTALRQSPGGFNQCRSGKELYLQ